MSHWFLVVYFDLFTGSSFDGKDTAQLDALCEKWKMPFGPFDELVKEWRKRKSFLFSTLQSDKSIDLTPKSQEQMIHLFMDQQNWNSKEGVDYYAMPLLDRDDMVVRHGCCCRRMDWSRDGGFKRFLSQASPSPFLRTGHRASVDVSIQGQAPFLKMQMTEQCLVNLRSFGRLPK